MVIIEIHCFRAHLQFLDKPKTVVMHSSDNYEEKMVPGTLTVFG